jgi:hypothetical protein
MIDLEQFWKGMADFQRSKNERLSEENRVLWDVSLRLVKSASGEVDGRKITDHRAFTHGEAERLMHMLKENS